jgi:hypothetical protein
MVLKLYKLMFIARAIARQKLSGKQNQKTRQVKGACILPASRQQQIITHGIFGDP